MMNSHSILRSVSAILLAATMILSLPCAGFAEIRIDASVLPESEMPVQLAVTVNTLALGLLLPVQNGSYYLLYWEDFPAILSQYLGFELGNANAGEISDELLTSLAMCYGKILISVAGIFNFSRKKMDYQLSAFNVSPKCVVWTCSPSRRDWSKMLTKLFSTALSDADLAALISPEAMALIREGKDHITELTDLLDGLSFQAATDDDNIYAVKLAKNGESLSYQYPGVPSSEHAIVYKKNGDHSVLVYAVSELNSAAVQETPQRISSAAELAEILSYIFALFSESVA